MDHLEIVGRHQCAGYSDQIAGNGNIDHRIGDLPANEEKSLAPPMESLVFMTAVLTENAIDEHALLTSAIGSTRDLGDRFRAQERRALNVGYIE